uniref:EvC ciliary complex subunit 1 n=1 Tax=Crocodylus porosus TaxID=8502 RepID=A0A7M4E6R8_CROPO
MKKIEAHKSKKAMALEGSESPLTSNITAFALKAKVIYPINQKFRPLADGSSNPSLHENPKQAVLPNQVVEASTSSSLGSLSQGDKEDCSSSTTIHSATSDDRFQARTFLKVTCFPEVLTCESFDVKLCLYSLLLKDLLFLDVELRKEKYMMVIQVLRVYLTEFYLKKKINEESYQKILLKQETDFDELQKQLNSRLQSTEAMGTQNSEYQTLDDLERKEREYSEHIIDNMEAFWKQTDEAQQFVLDQAKCSSAKARKIIMNLTDKMIVVEELLSESQDLQSMDIPERLFNWELMVKMVDSVKSRIEEESKCRFNAMSNILDHLTIKSSLSVRQKEDLLAELHKAFWEQVTHYKNECVRQAKDLIMKQLACRASKIEELKQGQENEQSYLLNKDLQVGDLHEFLQAYHELLEKQRQTQWNLEEVDNRESTEAVVDLHKLWAKEYALSAVMQKRLSEKHEKIIQGVLNQLGGLSEESTNYILRKHRLLLCSVLRRLSLRNVAMATLTHMRMSRKKNLLQELREQHVLQKSSSHCSDERQWQFQKTMESHILEEEEKLEEETQQTRSEFHHQFVTEIQEALQLMQQHVEQGIGQTLLQHARQEATKQSSEDREDLKERLTESAVESVYVTISGVNRVVQSYYQQIGKIMGDYEDKKLQQLKSLLERSENHRLKRKHEENEWTLKEKPNEGTLDISSAVPQRMLLQQKRFLAQFDMQQQARLKSLKQRILALHHLETEVENQLKQAEQDFITEVAGLARVPLPVHKQPLNRTTQSEISQSQHEGKSSKDAEKKVQHAVNAVF